MKESATISLSLIRSRLARTENSFNFTTSDIHIHVPSGATPKDGPSAGVTLFTSLASLITGKTVDPLLAINREITLSGGSCRSGGSRRRSLPHTGGDKKSNPAQGESNRTLRMFLKMFRGELTFIPVETVEEVLKEALGIEMPRTLVMDVGNNFVHGAERMN